MHQRITVIARAAFFGVAVALAAGGSQGQISAQQPGPDPRLQELAERLLTPFQLGPGAQPLTVQLLPGELPSDLGQELPLPPGHRVIGSAVRRTGSGDAAGATIVLEAPGTAAGLLAFYEQELTARGWTSAPFFGPGSGPSGLQPTQLPVSRGYCLSARGPSLNITVLPKFTGPSDVRLNVDSLFPYCDQRGYDPLGADLLPPLYTPPGIELLPSNPQQPISGGKPALSSTDGIAETSLPVAELEAHFAAQLAAAGWQRLDGGMAGPLAWSSWVAPAQGEWRGFLFVVEGPGPNQRAIHVQVTTAAAPPR